MIFKKIIINLIKDINLVQKYFNINLINLNNVNFVWFYNTYRIISCNFFYYIVLVEIHYYNYINLIQYTYNCNNNNLDSLNIQIFNLFNYWNFFKNIKLDLNFLEIFKKNLYVYTSILLNNIKFLLIPLLISVCYFFISLFYIQIDFTKQISLWYILLVSYYLLISGFNSFLSKYRYGKFTSAIQRFWKRTGMIFWLLEGFLFLLFFYYFLNSSQEPLYMFDFSNLNQEFLIQLKVSYKNLILLSVAIYLGFILILNLNFFIFYQSILLLMFVSAIIFYSLYIESYQFVYIINIFCDKDWIFDDIKHTWVLEVEDNNLRVKQQYFILCLIAKYWHFIFIFISWFFFLVKSIEIGNISITLLGYNVQNLIILYVLNLLCLVQWVKIIFKKFFDLTYYWFYIQYDEKFIISFINEFILTILGFFEINNNLFSFNISNISLNLYTCNEIILWKYV